MKILFVVPQLDYADQISVAYLSAVVKNLGHETEFFNARVNECRFEESFCILSLQLISPDIIAYTTTIQHFEEICYWNAMAKKNWDFISILGGAHATFAPETFKDSGMDYYCIGEGESAFEIFLKGAEAGLGVTKNNVVISPNIICKGGYNHTNVKRLNLIQDLDSLPFPDRDLTLANSYLKDTPKKTFYTSRGCPYSCSYCANNHYNKMYRGQKIVRRFSVDRIIEEIQYVKSKYRCDFIKFGDDLFALKADDWLYEFSVEYMDKINIPFNCYLRIDSVDDSLLTMLKMAGCHSVHLSIDSVNPDIRERILNRKSKSNIWQIGDKLELIHKYGIETWVNYMLAAPESTVGDDLHTMTISKISKVSYTSYSMTDPIKGTDLYDYCIDKGYIDKSYSGDMSNCSTRSTLKCFTNKDKDVRYNIYLLGALCGKVPYWILFCLIFYIKPNRFFEWIHKKYYEYNIEKVIFKL
tara:strand:- start:10677 stop:12083 length:1407 start_codon:yes stop_codon:yes gene_type:complete